MIMQNDLGVETLTLNEKILGDSRRFRSVSHALGKRKFKSALLLFLRGGIDL